MKRKIIIWTTVCLLVWSLAIPCGSAFAAKVPQAGTDLYHYVYQGEQYETSDHHFTFQWWYKDTPRESVRNRYHATNIFKLENANDASNQPAAYCSDFLYSIVSESRYKRLNLEDSTYYNASSARHIRSIMENGYWYDWTLEDLRNAEETANEWLETYDSSSFKSDAFLPYDAEEDVIPISNLTADEALMATQLAIWAFANTEGDDWWVKYYESLPTDVENKYKSQELPDNVKTFRKYLIHQQSLPLAPEDLLFSDQYFITDSVAFTGSASDAAVYDLRLRVKLAAPIDERDQLTLTANLPNGTSASFPMTGEDSLLPDNDGYYTLLLSDVSKDAAASVSLHISGLQYTEGIYFYEAQSEGETPRETSQNLVGKAAGMTPVSASTDLAYDVGTDTVTLEKKDAETKKPLAGAIFDLYGEREGIDHLVLRDLITDDHGRITVSNLPEGFQYYFVETKAPEGYHDEADGTVYAVDEDGFVCVHNQKTPVSEPAPEPDSPRAPETPIEPDPQKEPVKPQVSVEPEKPEDSKATIKPVIFDNSADELSANPSKAPNNADTVEPLPKTGDTSSLEISFLLLLIGSLGILCCGIYKKH